MAAVSDAMIRALVLVERLAPTEIIVALHGETGTGKDVLARLVHDLSARAEGPFVVFDCGAVVASLAESELFGHERGSFTGAHAAHPGAFERANGGTLFLDEVGELSLDLQPRLLRALESRRIRRVGGAQYQPVDLRVVTATNRDLKALVADGRFREDLYFRLGTAAIQVPALRDRKEDIPLLVRSLVDDLGRSNLEISEETYELLRGQPWPGNIRELKNALACALAFVENDQTLEPKHFSQLETEQDDEALDRLPLGGQSLEVIERAAIRQTLAGTHGNKAVAAQVLGIAVSTLYEKLKKFKL